MARVWVCGGGWLMGVSNEDLLAPEEPLDYVVSRSVVPGKVLCDWYREGGGVQCQFGVHFTTECKKSKCQPCIS